MTHKASILKYSYRTKKNGVDLISEDGILIRLAHIYYVEMTQFAMLIVFKVLGNTFSIFNYIDHMKTKSMRPKALTSQ